MNHPKSAQRVKNLRNRNWCDKEPGYEFRNSDFLVLSGAIPTAARAKGVNIAAAIGSEFIYPKLIGGRIRRIGGARRQRAERVGIRFIGCLAI